MGFTIPQETHESSVVIGAKTRNHKIFFGTSRLQKPPELAPKGSSFRGN